MRMVVLPACVVAFAALVGACSGELVCTEELRVAVRVHISSPENLPVDLVTADHRQEQECGSSSMESDSPDGIYRCSEQGGGDYTIRVYSGDLVWSQGIEIDANECHTTEIRDVDIVMDPAAAEAD
jgi:hypothetical protein